MTAVRQDAWSAEDDLILAEVTLRHIREGSTQLNAFEEVGERIGRTAAACGFRWNSCVRKKYEAAISIAKAQRQKRNYMKKQTPLIAGSGMASLASVEMDDGGYRGSDGVTEETISIDAVIRFLRGWKSTVQETNRQMKSLEKELREKEEELAALREENERLSTQVNEVQTDYRVVNDDYKALIQIMDRARRLAFLNEEDEESKSRFKMDANGNLERIE
ncbi:Prespore-specific transcriptional regulator RsfA [compost metagenome]|uniref:RsfA family transcriptional regulator n=1 Tax=Paenibacillus rhizolycopersici TaxID=2780073 RepID=A0ABS2H0N6_9BACL|nr:MULTISPECIES: RsfA family transcriptional regulator [Paenibacillus]MBM6994867.1 RsfA family transcriptional regulator [Paenibacillus rhizolycopersici]MUG88091.1 RsfA family transcriptional regulator [Paenibacillus timonensis]GIP48183.1 transcriptional regulator [Paenibacillus sp. J53TS2]